MSKRDWILTITITGPDGEIATANFSFDNVERLTHFKEQHTGTNTIRILARTLVDSVEPDDEEAMA